MPYTEFFCDATNGSNLYGGRINTDAEPNTTPIFSDVTGTATWSTGSNQIQNLTSVAGVSAGDWVGIAPTGTAESGVTTSVGYWAQVTGTTSTTITVSATIKFGTAPSNGASIDINVGGRWKGPNSAVIFPFGYITASAQAATNRVGRVNFKNNASYVCNNATTLTHNIAGPIVFQGYATSAGDLGRATINGSTGSAYNLIQLQGGNMLFADFIVGNTGNSGGNASTGIAITTGTAGGTGAAVLLRVSVTSARSSGYSLGAYGGLAIECEATGCNASTGVGLGGFILGAFGVMCLRCVSHNNSAANTAGFVFNTGAPCSFIECVSYNNTYGFLQNAGGLAYAMHSIIDCTTNANSSHAIYSTPAAATSLLVENCLIGGNGSTGTAHGITITNPILLIARNNQYFNISGSNVANSFPSNYGSFLEGVTTISTSSFMRDASNGDYRPEITTRPDGWQIFQENGVSVPTKTYKCCGAVQPNKPIFNPMQ